MNAKKDFTKRFLYNDEKKAESLLNEAEQAKENLNLFISNAERVMRTEFSKAERKLLKEDGYNFIKERIKEISPFKNSNEDFNLEAMGMQEVRDIYTSYKLKSSHWNKFNFELNTKDQFILSEKEKEAIKERASVYTSNIKQNEAFDMASRLIEVINPAIEKGYFEERTLSHFREMTDILDVENGKVIPNTTRILRLIK